MPDGGDRPSAEVASGVRPDPTGRTASDVLSRTAGPSSSTPSETARMMQLPAELMLDTFDHVDQRDLLVLARTCKAISKVAVGVLYVHPLIRESPRSAKDPATDAMYAFFVSVRSRVDPQEAVRSIRWVRAAFGSFGYDESTQLRDSIVVLPNCTDFSIRYRHQNGSNSLAEALRFASICTPAACTFRLDTYSLIGNLTDRPPNLERLVLSSGGPGDDGLKQVWSFFGGSLHDLAISTDFLFPAELTSLKEVGESLKTLTLVLADLEDGAGGKWESTARLAKLLPRLETLAFQANGPLDVLDETYPSLTTLQLELCRRCEVMQVTKLLLGGRFPCLRTMGVWYAPDRARHDELDAETDDDTEEGEHKSSSTDEALEACERMAKQRGIRWFVEKQKLTEWR